MNKLTYIKLIFIIFYLHLSIIVFSQNDDFITWNKNYKLKIEDFKGEPYKSPKINAYAGVGIAYKYSLNSNLNFVDIKITAFFDRNKSSFVKSDNIKVTLEHEQLHFDIAEIYSRKIRKELIDYKFRRINFEKKFLKIYMKFRYKDMKNLNMLYDKETTYPINEVKQLEWNNRIAEMLKELEAYSEPNIKVKLKKTFIIF